MRIKTPKASFQIHYPETAHTTIKIWHDRGQTTITGAKAKALQKAIEAEKDEYLDRLNKLISTALEQESCLVA